MRPHIYKVAITGGPQSGRSTAVAKLKEFFSKDFEVYTVPSVYSLISRNPIDLQLPKEESERRAFLRKMVQLQMDLEHSFESIAESNKKSTVMIVNGGVCDIFAGISQEELRELLEEIGWNMNFLSNARYQLVFFLMTAATGAAEHFLFQGKPAGEAKLAEARKMNQDLLEQWKSHHALEIVDNFQGFNQKMDLVVKIAGERFGIQNFVDKKKFLMEPIDMMSIVPKELHLSSTSEIMDYLTTETDQNVRWIVKRVNGNEDFPVFFEINREINEDKTKQVETRRILSDRQYVTLLKMKSDKFKTVDKKLISFMFEDKSHHFHVFKIEEINFEGKKLTWLRTDADRKNVPEFLEKFIKSDISDDKSYYTFKLAMK